MTDQEISQFKVLKELLEAHDKRDTERFASLERHMVRDIRNVEEHYEQKFVAHRQIHDDADKHAAEIAIGVDRRLQERFETQNTNLVTALLSVNTRLEGIDKKIGELQISVGAGGARGSGMKDMWGWIMAAIMAGAALVGILGPYMKGY